MNNNLPRSSFFNQGTVPKKLSPSPEGEENDEEVIEEQFHIIHLSLHGQPNSLRERRQEQAPVMATAVSKAEEFVALVEKSGLLKAGDAQSVVDGLNGEAEPKNIARALVKQGKITRWQAGQLLSGRSNFLLGKYQLIDLIGRRGMGNLFLAQHTTMSRRVALKVVSKKIESDPKLIQKFLGEARSLASLDHRNIVQAYSVDEENGRYYLVMEHVDGENLKELVNRDGPLPFEQAAEIVRQVAGGLAHAHERGFIHGGVNPDILVIARDGTVKILDMCMGEYGLTSQEDSTEFNSESVDFMAPEQFNEEEPTDPRSDIYSLGCTLYYCLTGSPPFSGGSVLDRIDKHRSEEPSGILKRRPNTPTELVQACRKMMSKQPDDRFKSADVVAQVLSNIQWPDPQTDAKPAPPKAAPAPKKRQKIEDLTDPEEVDTTADDPAALFAALAAGASNGKREGKGAGKNKIAAAPVVEKKQPAAAPTKAKTKSPHATPAHKRAETAVAPAKPGGSGSLDDAEVEAVSTGSAKKWLLIGGGIGLAAIFLAAGAISAVFLFMGPGDEPSSAEGEVASAMVEENAPADRDSDSATEPPQGETGGNDGGESGIVSLPVPEGTKGPGEGDEADNGEPSDEPGGDVEDAGAGSDQGDGPEGQIGDSESRTPGPNNPKEKDPHGENKAGGSGENNGSGTDEPKKEPSEPKVQKPDFKNLPKAIALPSPGDDDTDWKSPVVLGSVTARQRAPWDLRVAGGRVSGRNEGEFQVKHLVMEDSKSEWAINFVPDKGEPAEVARVNRDGEELKFQWTETPRGVPADALKCALLLVDVDGLDHGIALMTPQTVEPFTIELDKPSLRQQISLEAPVESDQIKVEIVKADGVGKTLIDPPEPVPGNTPIKLAVVRNDRHNNDSEGVIYRVKATLRRDRLMMQADLVAPTPSVFVQTFQQLTSNREMIEKQKKQLEEQFKKSRGGPREQARLALDQIDAGMWYADFFGKVHEKAEIHYRIFMEVAGRQIDLVVTKSAE